MAHFAQLDENNIVINVIVINNHEIIDSNGAEQESLGIQICQAICGDQTKWVQTSYNGNFRGMYAQIGGSYDPVLDIFVAEPEPEFEWN